MSLPLLPTQPPASAEMVEIQLGHMCNNRCVFCSSGHLTELRQAMPMELAPVITALDRAKAQGARRITFLGGEPTLQRAFLPALEHAAKLGFDEIEIFTNGVKASRASFVEQVAALGRFSWRFSIQGGDREAHDRAVVKEGAFDRITQAMDNVRATGHRITANACINELSYRSLPGYVELVRRHGVEQLHIDVVRPVSVGERPEGYLAEIIPRHADMAPYLREMLERFEAWDPDFDVNVGNYPPCLLPEWAHRIHHGGESTLTVASREDNSLYNKDKYAFQAEDKRLGPRCHECVLRARCAGVFTDYIDIYGADELEPVDLDQLSNAGHALATGALPHINALLETTVPDGWTATRPLVDLQDRRVSLWLDHAAGDGLERALGLSWALPGEPGPTPLYENEAIALRIIANPELDLRAVPSLAAWVRDTLATANGGIEPFETAQLVAACIDPERLQRASSAIDRAVGKLAHHPSRDGWSFLSSAPDPVWPGARVEFGRDDERVVCSLRAHHRRGGPAVMVGAQAQGATPDEHVRACLEALREALARS